MTKRLLWSCVCVCVFTHCSQKEKSRDEKYAYHTHIGLQHAMLHTFLLSGKCSFTQFSAIKVGSRFLHLVRKKREREMKHLKRRKYSQMTRPTSFRSNVPYPKQNRLFLLLYKPLKEPYNCFSQANCLSSSPQRCMGGN